MSECLRVAKNPWFVCRVFEQIDAREPGHFHLGPQCILQCRKVARCSSVAALFAAKGLNLKACSGNYSTIFHIHVSLCNVDWFFNVFSRKTFRRRVLQKIVGVSHTTHIPHISHTTHIPHISITPHISHTYPFKTYPTNTYPFNTYPTSTYPCNAYPFKTFASAGFAIRIPPIRIPPIQIRSTRIPPIRIHAMRIHSKGVHQQESQTYPTNTYPTNTYLQHVSHQYGSIQCVSMQKVCISRNGNEYEYHCISFHPIATRREW